MVLSVHTNSHFKNIIFIISVDVKLAHKPMPHAHSQSRSHNVISIVGP